MATAETLAVGEDTSANIGQVELIALDLATIEGSTMLATLFRVMCFRSNLIQRSVSLDVDASDVEPAISRT